MALSCDHCGTVGGVRKRTCLYKVSSSGLRSGGRRIVMPYCPAPAYCGACFTERGGTKKIHENCKVPAERSQAEYDAERAKLETGEFHVTSAFGSWHDSVPEEYVGVYFQNLNGDEVFTLLLAGDYNPSTKPWLSDYQNVLLNEVKA